MPLCVRHFLVFDLVNEFINSLSYDLVFTFSRLQSERSKYPKPRISNVYGRRSHTANYTTPLRLQPFPNASP